MKHGSLFSGIGGFDLAAEWIGWENVFHCEWNEFGKKVLKHYWPKSISYNDITKTDFSVHRGDIDILTGGFPCQPYSSAGKRLGKADDRHLWPHMLRTITEIRPRWIVGENVRGLTNWNGGMVFDEVQIDLEAEGYEVLPFLLPACSVGAPHRRDRIWFIAHAISTGQGAEKFRQIRRENGKIESERTQTFFNATRSNGSQGIATNTDINIQHRSDCEHEKPTSNRGEHAFNDIEQVIFNTNSSGRNSFKNERGYFEERQERRQFSPTDSTSNNWEKFPTEPPICGGNDGLPRELDGITFPKWREESIKAFGNAVVPQVVFQIFKAIEQYEKEIEYKSGPLKPRTW